MDLKNNVLTITSVFLLSSLFFGAAQGEPADAALLLASDTFEQVFDEAGHLLVERGIEPTNPELGYVMHFMREKDWLAKGGKPGGGGGGSNDCASTAYKLSGFHWTEPWSAKASSYASVLNSAGNAWEAETGADIFGGISSGSDGVAGVQDFKNQIDWVYLGTGGTVAVTTTWYYRGSGVAVESDARYNTYYAWSTSGDANAMDVGHVGTHEIGHSFGLGHPNGSGIACLTMYAYVDFGQTHGRTLGTGDILGLEAIYGA